MKLNPNQLDKAEDMPFRTSRKHLNRSYHSGESGKDPYYFISRILKACVGKTREVIYSKLKEKSRYSKAYPWSSLNYIIDDYVSKISRSGNYVSGGYRNDEYTLEELKKYKGHWGKEYYWDSQGRLQVIKQKQGIKLSKRARYKAKLVKKDKDIQESIWDQIQADKGHCMSQYQRDRNSYRTYKYLGDVYGTYGRRPPKIFKGYRYVAKPVSSSAYLPRRTWHYSQKRGGGIHTTKRRVFKVHYITVKEEVWYNVSWNEYYHLLNNPKFDFLWHAEQERVAIALQDVGKKHYKRLANMTHNAIKAAALA